MIGKGGAFSIVFPPAAPDRIIHPHREKRRDNAPLSFV